MPAPWPAMPSGWARPPSPPCPLLRQAEPVKVLVDCMAEIASAAPDLPFYYYHIPGLTGVNLDMVEFLRQGARIPTLAGIKYCSPTLYELQACVALKAAASTSSLAWMKCC
ncbi:MAG: dihydrodipicolinate synthase family protein [Anaerolineae bacterium]|nr:MAG: dihydrodipicolinate synthase family protein [Anaerolineae bacterium]